MSVDISGKDRVPPTTERWLDSSSTPDLSKTTVKKDAGLSSLDHYQSRLPVWRYVPRQKLLPLVRWETPYLALIQNKMRSPALDSYFSTTANLGTHTFFLVVLPILFWCGYTSLGRGMVHILASGVFFSGFLKDLLCIPRPLSPPLQRITMSRSAALEYGFPSTHSTNAVSVAVYTLFALHSPETTVHPQVKLVLEAISYCYATSIILGRLYCGMHGFLDVIIGGLLGASLSVVQCVYGEQFDDWMIGDSLEAPMILLLTILVLVRIHPEPADDCPCFDDSVAFAGVMIGVELGVWHYAKSDYSWDYPVPATTPFQLEALGWPKAIARIIIGVLTILAWREIMKPAMLRSLPPIFRIVERLGLSLPRRFFVQASEYQKVPNQKDDNVIPSVSEIPSLITSIRHPRRSRSVSVGPQSEADAYETLAYREKRRKESTSSLAAANLMLNENAEGIGNQPGCFSMTTSEDTSDRIATTGLQLAPSARNGYHKPLKLDTALDIPGTPSTMSDVRGALSRRPSDGRRQYEKEEREIFSNLEKPRVRYDVEVITKLVVYTGIAWIAVEGNPILFEVIGLGLGKRPK